MQIFTSYLKEKGLAPPANIKTQLETQMKEIKAKEEK
jgi:hypothetical protein